MLRDERLNTLRQVSLASPAELRPGCQYLYGIIDGAQETAVSAAASAVSVPLHTISQQGIACLVGHHNGGEFARLSAAELAQLLHRHQRVIEHIAQTCPVLPVNFGPPLASTGEARALLAQERARFAAMLRQAHIRIQVRVVATWGQGQALQQIASDPAIAHARDALLQGQRPGAPQGWVPLGQLVKTALQRRRARYREQLVRYLHPPALDWCDGESASAEVATDLLFLVAKHHHQAFHARLNQLDSLFGGEIAVHALPPLSPYAFSTLAITRTTPPDAQAPRFLVATASGASRLPV